MVIAMAVRVEKENNRFSLAKQQLCMCVMLFLCMLQDVNTRHNDFLLLFMNFDTVFKNSTTEKFGNISQTESDGIIAKHIEAVQVMFS